MQSDQSNASVYPTDKPFAGVQHSANYVPPYNADKVLTDSELAMYVGQFRYTPLRSDRINVSHLEQSYARGPVIRPDGTVDVGKRMLQVDQIAQNRLHASMPRSIRIFNETRRENQGGIPFRKQW